MTRKRITRKYTDLIHVAIFIVILLLFANYESERKTHVPSAFSPSDANFSLRIGQPLNSNITWK